ncbi:hypothetical protein GIB67_011369 [Kingdonia uniflora]|uniref:Sister chromatid cohesion protein n=1 Tax=Kingdonia uniflora TaxID=39325 RepID=A0A7J7LCU2_9MAGN|nr:hypothetical protein GIB67_011369 [Kingdonia uniflora]
MDMNEEVRQSALKIVEVVLRQGLVHPITCVPYHVALETDAQEVNSKLAHHLPLSINENNVNYDKILSLLKKYLHSEDIVIKVRSLQALGFVLIARPEYMLKRDIQKILEATFSSGSNARLKVHALQNMHEYLLDAESQMGTDKNGSSNVIQYPKEGGHSVHVASGAGDTNIYCGIIQLYWEGILGRCMDMNEEIVEVVLRQGLVHQITCVPYLIALETDVQEVNSKLAHHLLLSMNEKYCTEILTSLPLTTPDESLYLIYTINRFLQVRSGSLEATMKALSSLSIREYKHAISYENGVLQHDSSVLQQEPYSPAHSVSIHIKEEDAIMYSPTLGISCGILKDNLQSNQADCQAAIALQLLLKFKRHLKIAFGLSDVRFQEFSLNEPLKPGEALSRQNIPFDISGTHISLPTSHKEIIERYQVRQTPSDSQFVKVASCTSMSDLFIREKHSEAASPVPALSGPLLVRGRCRGTRPSTTRPDVSTAAYTGVVPHNFASMYTYMESGFGRLSTQMETHFVSLDTQIQSQFQLFRDDIGWLQTSVEGLSCIVRGSLSGPPAADTDEGS